ncbi:MAG: endopeptidase IV [Tatlockia sp.]|jgi:hypothetical protein
MKTIKQCSEILLLSLLAFGVAHATPKQNAEADTEIESKATVEKDNGKPPIGCRNTGYDFVLQTLHLSPGGNGLNQSMYFLYNQSNQAITLYQMRSEDSARSLYLNHVIGAHEWGIFSTGEKQVKYICTVPNRNMTYGQVVDCAQSLTVCEYVNVKYGLNNRGNFWLANSSTRNGAVNAVVHYGIIPGI